MQFIISAVVASVTVGGKAIGKNIAAEHSTKIVHAVANVLNKDPNKVFKTLVTVSKSKQNYVFMIPVHKELDLKKCAQSVNEKSIEMIHQKELLPLTGYVHGGCSPIGLKKPFKIVIDDSAKNFKEIIFSGGKIGYQVEVELNDLEKERFASRTITIPVTVDSVVRLYTNKVRKKKK